MSSLIVRCPKCEIELEGHEQYIGIIVSCTYCDCHFPLWRDQSLLPIYPNQLDDFEIGILAKAGLSLVFLQTTFTDDQLDLLQEKESCNRIFAFEYPLLKKQTAEDTPVASTAHIDGDRCYQPVPVFIQDKSYFVFNSWHESSRENLIAWFRQNLVSYDDLRSACKMLNQDSSKSFTLNHPPIFDLAHMKPQKLIVEDREYPVESWQDIVCGIGIHVYEASPDKLHALSRKEFSKIAKCVFNQTTNNDSSPVIKIADGFSLEGKLTRLLQHIELSRDLAEACDLDLTRIVVCCSTPQQRISCELESDKEIDVATLSFMKTVDWSTFQSGISIPRRLHQSLLSHLSSELLHGRFHVVDIMMAGNRFSASVHSPKFSDTSRSAEIQIKWGANSSIAKCLQARYRKTYDALLLDRKNRDVLTEKFEVRTAAQKDVFEFVFDASNHAFDGNDARDVEAFEELEIFTSLLERHFPNGFRVDSPIEIMRFRNFSAESAVDGLELSDGELKEAIISCGILFEGKIYVLGKETENRLKEEIEKEVERGADIIYYASLYARHESWLNAGSIISEKMLKVVLKRIFPVYQYRSRYFLIKKNSDTEVAIIRGEIMRVWDGGTLFSYEQISERLPYIPLDKIKYMLTQSGEFIWNSTEVYTHIGNVDITDEEQADIANYVANACRTVGYASLFDVPLGEIVVRNYELTQTAIHNAVYSIVLSEKYDRRGKIVSRKGDVLDALTIMKEHCRTINKCTLQELLDYERELTGESHRWIPMEAGYAVLVRTTIDTFVAEKYVSFDISGTDDTLDLFVTGNYLPLRGFTTFASFPHCGQEWNLFLLESFCRRFSNRFRFDVLAVNSRNAGVIVRKNCDLSYGEIMADGVAASDVELKKDDVIEFLCNKGYIGKRSYSKTDELIEHAKAIREGMN